MNNNNINPGGRYVIYYWNKKSNGLDKILRCSFVRFIYQFWLAYLLAAFRYICIDICSLKTNSNRTNQLA